MSTGNLLIIGISGATCAGKTTTATHLNNILPNSKVFSQDDYFLDVDDPRHTLIPELNHINFDILSSLDMEKMHKDVLEYIEKHNLKRTFKKTNFIQNGLSEEDLSKIVHKKLKNLNVNVIIIEGFSILNYRPMLNLFDLKYFFTLSYEECQKRRVTRVYEPPDCPGYFEICVWPEHLLQKKEVTKTVQDVIYFDENTEDVLGKVLIDINQYL